MPKEGERHRSKIQHGAKYGKEDAERERGEDGEKFIHTDKLAEGEKTLETGRDLKEVVYATALGGDVPGIVEVRSGVIVALSGVD